MFETKWERVRVYEKGLSARSGYYLSLSLPQVARKPAASVGTGTRRERVGVLADIYTYKCSHNVPRTFMDNNIPIALRRVLPPTPQYYILCENERLCRGCRFKPSACDFTI